MVRITDPDRWTISDIHIATDGKHKYVAILTDKDGEMRRVPFGDIRYQHYEDKLGAYSSLNHLNETRRRSFERRHAENIRHKFSSAWFAKRILW